MPIRCGRWNAMRAVRIHRNGCTWHSVMWLRLVQHVALWFLYVWLLRRTGCSGRLMKPAKFVLGCAFIGYACSCKDNMQSIIENKGITSLITKGWWEWFCEAIQTSPLKPTYSSGNLLESVRNERGEGIKRGRQPLHKAVSHSTRRLRYCCAFLKNISLPQLKRMVAVARYICTLSYRGLQVSCFIMHADRVPSYIISASFDFFIHCSLHICAAGSWHSQAGCTPSYKACLAVFVVVELKCHIPSKACPK